MMVFLSDAKLNIIRCQPVRRVFEVEGTDGSAAYTAMLPN